MFWEPREIVEISHRVHKAMTNSHEEVFMLQMSLKDFPTSELECIVDIISQSCTQKSQCEGILQMKIVVSIAL
jgi:hypothetical protein